MDHARFETLKGEIAAHATVDQLIDLEAQTARLLSERVSEALVARRAVEVATTTSARTAAARRSSGMAATAPAGSASASSRPTTARGADGPSTPSAARPSPG